MTCSITENCFDNSTHTHTHYALPTICGCHLFASVQTIICTLPLWQFEGTLWVWTFFFCVLICVCVCVLFGYFCHSRTPIPHIYAPISDIGRSELFHTLHNFVHFSCCWYAAHVCFGFFSLFSYVRLPRCSPFCCKIQTVVNFIDERNAHCNMFSNRFTYLQNSSDRNCARILCRMNKKKM